MTVSSTGRFALQSQSGVRGVEIWVDEVNAKGGIDVGGTKRMVELVQRDDRSDKQMVPRVYETLIEEEDVDILFGPFGSTLTGAAAQVSEREDVFMVIWSASSDAIYEQGFEHLVSATQIAASLLAVPSVEIAHELGVEELAIVYIDEPFPAGMAEGARAKAEELGIDVVQFEKLATGTKDFSIVLQKARASGAEGFYPVAYEGDQMTMLRQMQEMNITFPYTFMLYGGQPQFLDNTGEASEYLYSHTLYHEAINWDVTHGKSREEFQEAYDETFPDVAYAPDFQTALAYGAGVVTEAIIEKAGSLDPDALKEAALELSGDIVTMAGIYEIEETGKQIGMQNVIMQHVPDSGMQAVYPAAVATAEPIFPIPGWSER
jgi:branched-chain amino acid transport system substrate-binding protein